MESEQPDAQKSVGAEDPATINQPAPPVAVVVPAVGLTAAGASALPSTLQSESEVPLAAEAGQPADAKVTGVDLAARARLAGDPARDAPGQIDPNLAELPIAEGEVIASAPVTQGQQDLAEAAVGPVESSPARPPKKLEAAADTAPLSNQPPPAATPPPVVPSSAQAQSPADAAPLASIGAPAAASPSNGPPALPPVQPAAQSQSTPTRFAEANHPSIVTAVRGQLLPSGGTMQIRLDPPELGALLINVSVRDGLVDASFQTASADTAQLLSHSLTQLKHSLESQGVSVDRLQVAQAPRSERSDTPADRNNQQQSNQHNSSAFDASRQNEQHRREMLRRMWAKLGVGDPLDLVA